MSKITTAEQMMARVSQLMIGKEPDRDPLEATCWFIAYNEARGLLDAWTTKDIARSIRDGDRFGGPFKTAEHVQEWLDDQDEMGLPGEHLEIALKEFFS